MDLYLGTRVKIVNIGYIYSTYADMAKKMQLNNFEYGNSEIENYQIGRISAINFHEFTGMRLYGVSLADKDIIIGHQGVEPYKDCLLEMKDELFEL